MEQAKIYHPEEYGNLVGKMLPIYSTTKGLSNHTIVKAMQQAVARVDFSFEYLPIEIMEKEGFCSVEYAVRQMHFPTDKSELIKARKRLVFDEFFLFILILRRMRDTNQELENHYPMIEVAETERMIEALPYRLTSAQQKVWCEIQSDLTSRHTMNRLIQGDVGSGKTILAFLALIMCKKSKDRFT